MDVNEIERMFSNNYCVTKCTQICIKIGDSLSVLLKSKHEVRCPFRRERFIGHDLDRIIVKYFGSNFITEGLRLVARTNLNVLKQGHWGIINGEISKKTILTIARESEIVESKLSRRLMKFRVEVLERRQIFAYHNEVHELGMRFRELSYRSVLIENLEGVSVRLIRCKG